VLTRSCVGYPSPMDRVRATRLAVKCVQWLEDPDSREEGCTSSVIGIRGGNVVFSDSETLEVQEADFETRRSKVIWWSGLKKVSTTLSINTPPPPISPVVPIFLPSGWFEF
jgi:6-phosphofructokinase 1